jgi:hypothetical protein
MRAKKSKKRRRHVCRECGGDRFRTAHKDVLYTCRSCGAVQGYCLRPVVAEVA